MGKDSFSLEYTNIGREREAPTSQLTKKSHQYIDTLKGRGNTENGASTTLHRSVNPASKRHIAEKKRSNFGAI